MAHLVQHADDWSICAPLKLDAHDRFHHYTTSQHGKQYIIYHSLLTETLLVLCAPSEYTHNSHTELMVRIGKNAFDLTISRDQAEKLQARLATLQSPPLHAGESQDFTLADAQSVMSVDVQQLASVDVNSTRQESAIEIDLEGGDALETAAVLDVDILETLSEPSKIQIESEVRGGSSRFEAEQQPHTMQEFYAHTKDFAYSSNLWTREARSLVHLYDQIYARLA